MALRAVLFDIDGTLVDSNGPHARAWVEVLAEFGRHVPYETIRPLIGMGADNLLPRIGLSAEEGAGKSITDRRQRLFLERYLPEIQPFPGTRDLLARIKQEGLRLGIATSSDEETKTALLKRARVKDLLDATTSADDAESSKPDPDVIQAALGAVGVRAEEAVMIGDTPYDVEAAGRAAVRTIGFRCGGWDDAGLNGAVEVYDGPWDLLERFGESLLARELTRA